MTRLRQAVLAARDLDGTVRSLRAALPLGEPFHDPAVAHFGLRNAVMALGDTFVEVVSPVTADAPAARFLDRRGTDAGGYMAMFQVADIAAARERIDRLGVRVAWRIDLPDVSDDHLHPSDMAGTIVAIDETRPPASWRWGGPAWTAAAPTHHPAGVTGLTLCCPDPGAAARRWAEVLGVAPPDPGATDQALALDRGRAAFIEGDAGLVAFAVAVPGSGRCDVEIAGVRFEVTGGQPPG